MAETTLETMVVKLVGDVTGYQRSLQQAQQQTQAATTGITQSGLGIEQGLKPGQKALGELEVRGRDARKVLGLIGMSGIIPADAVQPVWALAEGLGVAKSAMTGLAASTGLLKTALISTGIGALVVGLGAAAAWLTKMAEEAAKAREAASKAFQSMVSGARTASQAFADVRINTLTEGMQELADIVNPGFWRGRWNALQDIFGSDPLQNGIDRIVERAREAQRAFARLAEDPRLRQLQREIAVQRNVQAVRDSSRAMQEEAERAGLSEVAAKKLEMAQRFARETGISLAEANRRLARSFEEIDAAQQRISLGRIGQQLRELKDEADRAGLPEIESRLLGMAQAFLRDNPAVGSLGNAFRTLSPILNETRDALNRISFGEFTRSIREQVQVFGLSAERAQLWRLRLQGVAEASIQAALASVKQLEALRALQQPLERLTAVRAGSAEAFFQQQEMAQQREVQRRQNEIRQAPAGAGPLQAQQNQQRAEGRYDQQMLLVLQQIRDGMRQNNQRPQVNLQPAGITP